jgi:hypothetical protein
MVRLKIVAGGCLTTLFGGSEAPISLIAFEPVL